MTESLKVYCNSCNRKTNHEILKNVEREIHDDEVQVIFYDNWQIIKCLGCESISFRHISSNTDDYDPETGDHFENILLYPKRIEKTLPIKPFYNVPAIIRSIYRETIDAYNYDLKLLCAAGLRAIIESICVHEKIKNGPVEESNKTGGVKIVRKKDLMGKIHGLQEKGIITEKQLTMLHEFRYLGNEALHTIETPPKQVLIISIEIIEHILDFLYEIDSKAGELTWIREQKNKRKKKQSLKEMNP